MPVVFLLTGAFGFLMGFGVFILRAEDRRARLFFWLCMAFSSAVMISGEWYGVQGRPVRLIPGALFFFAYTLTPVLLLKFVRTFAARERPRGEPFLWAAALLFAAFFSAVLVVALLAPSIAIFRLKIYFSVFRLFFAVVCIASAVILFRAFRAAPSRERRDQIRWVLYGLVAGLGPFMFLYSLPRTFWSSSPLSEEAASGFFAILPLALAFAILKYRLLNIRVIINRSVVYSLLTTVTVGVYLLSIEGLKTLFAARPVWIPVGSAFIAAMVFAPARSRIQVLVDRAFFRQSYDYRRALLGFTTAAGEAHSAPDLLALFSGTLDEALPVEKIGAFVPAQGDGKPGTALTLGIDDEALAAVLAAPGGREEPLKVDGLRRAGFETVLPLPLGEAGPCGWIFVGPKRSGLDFTDEDRELLRALAAELAAALSRVRLQEEVIYERASREKLEEIGRLKTEFISSVSHELRTPMTSLQSISELLKSGKVVDASRATGSSSSWPGSAAGSAAISTTSSTSAASSRRPSATTSGRPTSGRSSPASSRSSGRRRPGLTWSSRSAGPTGRSRSRPTPTRAARPCSTSWTTPSSTVRGRSGSPCGSPRPRRAPRSASATAGSASPPKTANGSSRRSIARRRPSGTIRKASAWG